MLLNRVLLLGMWILTALAQSAVASPLPSPSCLKNLSLQIEKQTAQWDLESRKLSGQGLRPESTPQLVLGTRSEAVVVLHGFLSSPSEVSDLTQSLSRAGYTVFVPLTQGWGGPYQYANTATFLSWRQSVKKNLTLLQKCFPRFHVVAHSLGGALITDLALQNQEMHSWIKSLTLLTPYYHSRYPLPRPLQNLLLKRHTFVNLRLLQIVLKTKKQDDLLLPLPPLDTQSDPFVPLLALQQALDYQKVFWQWMQKTRTVKVPIFLVGSYDDSIVDTKLSVALVKKFFPHYQMHIYPANSGIGHYIHHADLNPQFQPMMQEIVQFLERN